MASQQATSIDCWFGAVFLDLCLSVPVSTGVIGRIHRLPSRFQTVSCPTNHLGEVLGLFWGANPTDQHELATAELLSTPLISSVTTGQMVVVGAIHPHDTTVFFLFARTATISRYLLRRPLVAGLNAVPNGLGAVSRRSASPPALLLEYCLSTHANRRPSAR